MKEPFIFFCERLSSDMKIADGRETYKLVFERSKKRLGPNINRMLIGATGIGTENIVEIVIKPGADVTSSEGKDSLELNMTWGSV